MSSNDIRENKILAKISDFTETVYLRLSPTHSLGPNIKFILGPSHTEDLNFSIYSLYAHYPMFLCIFRAFRCRENTESSMALHRKTYLPSWISLPIHLLPEFPWRCL